MGLSKAAPDKRNSWVKHNRKSLPLYKIFGYKPPFSILADGSFLHEAAEHKWDLLSNSFDTKFNPEAEPGTGTKPDLMLGHRTKIYISKCIEKLMIKDPSTTGIVRRWVNQLPKWKCPHDDDGTESLDELKNKWRACMLRCLSEAIRLSSRQGEFENNALVCASQDGGVLNFDKLRSKPLFGVIFITLKDGQPWFQKPSKQTLKLSESFAKVIRQGVQTEMRMEIIGKDKFVEISNRVSELREKKRKRENRGPNPLSVMKKKKRTKKATLSSSGKRQRSKKFGIVGAGGFTRKASGNGSSVTE